MLINDLLSISFFHSFWAICFEKHNTLLENKYIYYFTAKSIVCLEILIRNNTQSIFRNF